ncbi:MAG TPA: translation initiation factor IF-3 [Candidatus Binataceae bacterium]|nr:translation initiation factor IF-3 [Candidatus Binataceae bacterium]
MRHNNLIRAPEVRVIDADGKQAGIMNVRDAIRLAESRGLDLVEVASAAQPPVCRIVDFDKYRYAQKKKEHDSKRGSSASLIKEVKMGALTEKHDVEFKIKHIRRFVGEGQRVKLSVSFRGRQITHPELGRALIDGIIEQVRDVAQPEGTARMEGRNMSVLLTPR